MVNLLDNTKAQLVLELRMRSIHWINNQDGKKEVGDIMGMMEINIGELLKASKMISLVLHSPLEISLVVGTIMLLKNCSSQRMDL